MIYKGKTTNNFEIFLIKNSYVMILRFLYLVFDFYCYSYVSYSVYDEFVLYSQKNPPNCITCVPK